MMVGVALDVPPVVHGLGVGVHGRSGRLRDRFLLPDLWAFHLYRYRARLTLDGEEHELRAGSVSLVPPGVVTQYEYRGVSEHLYAHLRLPAGPVSRTVPAVADAGRLVAELTDLFGSAVTAFPTAPVPAAAYLWAALWRVCDVPAAAAEPAQARLAPVLAHVESRLAHPLPVAELAALAGVSPTHLTRLFRQVTGDTVVGYVRRRRLARAEHLLRRTTLPVATVARSVGVGDLQAFNKLCRQQLGASPSAVRAGATTIRPDLDDQ
jgi:AraC-like DNA-binding protein